MKETEITSLIRGKGYDPYANGDRFEHIYSGSCHMQAGKLLLKVHDSSRRGIFAESAKSDADIHGDFEDGLMLHLNLEAGRCNEGRCGYKWIKVQKMDPKDAWHRIVSRNVGSMTLLVTSRYAIAAR